MGLKVSKVDRVAKATASTSDMQYALRRASSRFNLGDDFVLTGYTDKGKNCTVSLDSELYTVAVTFKNKLQEGFPSLVGDTTSKRIEEALERGQDPYSLLNEEDTEEEE